MLKITVLPQMLIANEMLTTNEFDSIKVDDELIEKYGKLSKGLKLFKSKNSKRKKSAKSKKP